MTIPLLLIPYIRCLHGRHQCRIDANRPCHNENPAMCLHLRYHYWSRLPLSSHGASLRFRVSLRRILMILRRSRRRPPFRPVIGNCRNSLWMTMSTKKICGLRNCTWMTDFHLCCLWRYDNNGEMGYASFLSLSLSLWALTMTILTFTNR
jgi:hypothetical protein